MLLIKESIQDIEVLQEAGPDGSKSHFIRGIFMQANRQNKNGRIYPRETLQNECQRYIREYVTRNRAFGELGHPDTPKINEDRISHLITDLKEDGNNWIGKAKILDTDKGRIVKGILAGGGQLAASSRALGSLKESNGINVVQPDLRLMTAADIVIDPSAPDAFVSGIMEGVEWVFINGNWTSQNQEKAVKYLKESRNQEDYENRAANAMKAFFAKL
jgi:hypothetical protein